MFRTQFFFVLFLIKIISPIQSVRRQIDKNEELRYSVILSEPLDSTLDWDYYKDDKTKLIFHWKITLNNGYCGILAFSKYDQETDHLDVIILGEDEKIYNGYTDENSLLFIPDNTVVLDYTVESIENNDDGKKEYLIKLIRPLDTCDEEKRNYIIDRGTIHLLTGTMIHKDFHKIRRGKPIDMTVERMSLTLQRVQLLKSQAKFPPVSDDKPHLDFLNENVLIPDVETTYWCTRFEFPPEIMKKKHHIIRFDGIVSPQSEGVVHHMELFHCNVPPNTQIPPYNAACTSEQKPMNLTQCRRVIGAWAMGAANFTYPEDAGGYIGGPGTSRFLVLEVHFNNPYLKKGIIDQSGIRLYYTPKTRTYDAAIMEVGLEYNEKNSIPPGTKEFRISGYCSSECTDVGLPTDGITVFASQLHTHLNGRQAFTRIIKKSGEIIVLNVDRHYSPHFQEIRLLPKPIRIERGDVILHTCIYNTENHTAMTFGGFGIRDEMCVNYMHYYPRSDLELCKTSVRDDELKGFFKIMEQYDYANTSPQKTNFENYKSIRWTPLTASILETFYELAKINLSCNGSNGNYLPKFNFKQDYLPVEPEEHDIPMETMAKCK